MKLHKQSRLHFTRTQTYVKHPELVAARENKDYVVNQVRFAIDDLSKVTMVPEGVGSDEVGELAGAINEFEVLMESLICSII